LHFDKEATAEKQLDVSATTSLGHRAYLNQMLFPISYFRQKKKEGHISTPRTVTLIPRMAIASFARLSLLPKTPTVDRPIMTGTIITRPAQARRAQKDISQENPKPRMLAKNLVSVNNPA